MTKIMTMTQSSNAPSNAIDDSQNMQTREQSSPLAIKDNDSTHNDELKYIDADKGVILAQALEPYFRPDEKTIVCGALSDEKVQALADAGVELVVSLQTDEELSFDEATAVEKLGMAYEQLPISGAEGLKQINMLAFDKILRQYQGKKIAMHCGSGNRVGAAIALRAGWLRGRKMDTAMERGRSHGLTSLEQEVHNRLLVPR